MKLFCLPYAGGSEAIYYDWKSHFDSSINLEAVKLKGRGQRHGEIKYTDFDEAVDDIFCSIKDKINCNEYALFGHSMGAVLIFELYYKICKENCKKPIHMFFAGHEAPCIKKEKEKIYMLPDNDFLNKIINMGGTPKEILENQELIQYCLPLLKSDFNLIENYIYCGHKKKIECDITIFCGKEDDIKMEDLLAWKNHGNKGFYLYPMEGDHFFINQNIAIITKLIHERCLNSSARIINRICSQMSF